MNPMRGALWIIGAAVAAFLLWWGYGVYERSKTNELKAWEHSVDSASTVRVQKAREALIADTIYRAGETVYIRGRDRIRTSPGGNTPEVRACFALADSSRTLCARRHDADTAALHATERELALWKKKPDPPTAQRIQAYGEALYDISHTVPVIRLGATARLLGPLSLSVAGEYAAPPAGRSDPAFRALAGLRINF